MESVVSRIEQKGNILIAEVWKCLGACRNCEPRKPSCPGVAWLHDALNEIARVRAEQGDAQAFRLMQAQAMRVGQRRIELSMRIAELERIGR